MDEPFYKTGLSFECRRCSSCCRFQPGYVFLSRQDREALAGFFNLSTGDFMERYCRWVDLGHCSRLSLIEKSNLDCIFWEGGGCSVYSVRPLQCRSYPFWFSSLSSPEAWKDLAAGCPGINRGRKHGLEEIRSWLEQRRLEPYLGKTDDPCL
ncbi:MAG: YkgJ family cysteine cluster protein [Spirochaetales bacterium]|nr:YkgJ family cysteine cluster protein [Spirochaetales bacterium]